MSAAEKYMPKAKYAIPLQVLAHILGLKGTFVKAYIDDHVDYLYLETDANEWNEKEYYVPGAEAPLHIIPNLDKLVNQTNMGLDDNAKIQVTGKEIRWGLDESGKV